MWCGPMQTQSSSMASHNNSNGDPFSSRNWTSPSVAPSALVSQDYFHRMSATADNRSQDLVPSPTPPDQQASSSRSIKKLLKVDEDFAVNPPFTATFPTRKLPLPEFSQHHQKKDSHSKMQKSNHPSAVKPEPLGRLRNPSHSQPGQTQSTIVPVMPLTDQVQHFSSTSSSDPSSTLVQMPPSAIAFEPPTSNKTAQSNPMMNKELVVISEPINDQMDPKITAQKYKRATDVRASRRFRERRRNELAVLK